MTTAVVTKIQKLIEHAESAERIGNEAEAATFLAKAHKMMKDHDISSHDMQGMTFNHFEDFANSQLWKKYLAAAVAEYVGAIVISRRIGKFKSQMRVIGKEIRVETFKIMYPYLKGQVTRRAKDVMEADQCSRSIAIGRLTDSLVLRLAELSLEDYSEDQKEAVKWWEKESNRNASNKGPSRGEIRVTESSLAAAGQININRPMDGGSTLQIGSK